MRGPYDWGDGSENATPNAVCRVTEGEDAGWAPFADLDATDPMRFMAQFIDRLGLEVRFDGTFSLRGQSIEPPSRQDLQKRLKLRDLDDSDVLQQARLVCYIYNFQFSYGILGCALQHLIKHRRRERRNAVIGPLLSSTADPLHAQREWSRLATVFELNANLTIAIFSHFIWQVYRKALRLDVGDHLLPCIYSPVQGSGKTTFVWRFVSPVGELATGAATLADFADPRSAEIYSFPIVVLDDLDPIQASSSAVLKATLTAPALTRRRLGTSRTAGVRQDATPIATSNSEIDKLVQDPTGHRRFVQLAFRNGNVAKGGDQEIWGVVGGIDYEALWRSVDPFKPSPLKPHLRELVAYQDTLRPQSRVLLWLRTLGQDRERLLRITTRHGIGAEALHDLYVSDTGDEISQKRFSDQMMKLIGHPDVPFAGKTRTREKRFYTLRSEVS